MNEAITFSVFIFLWWLTGFAFALACVKESLGKVSVGDCIMCFFIIAMPGPIMVLAYISVAKPKWLQKKLF